MTLALDALLGHLGVHVPTLQTFLAPSSDSCLGTPAGLLHLGLRREKGVGREWGGRRDEGEEGVKGIGWNTRGRVGVSHIQQVTGKG